MKTMTDMETPSGQAAMLFSTLAPGDMLLVGARPGQGKTLMSLRLAVEAMQAGYQAVFFTLEYTERDLRDRFRAIGAEMAQFKDRFVFDVSDAIDAEYIMQQLSAAPRGTFVVMDYLQLLDQRRESAELAAQVAALKAFAAARGLILAFISQIDRSYDISAKPFPDLEDVRSPNPLDLSLFNRTCFLNNGAMRFVSV